ncbi:MAG: PQQ-dependent sugar dehydrogenase [Acidobacteriota bacterium]
MNNLNPPSVASLAASSRPDQPTDSSPSENLFMWLRTILLLIPLCFLLGAPAEASSEPPQSLASLSLQQVATGFSSPIGLANAGDNSDRLFVVEKAGIIRIIDGGTVLPTPFLNISGLVSTTSERGLLGLAFHPDYATNGLFFVHYSNNSGATTIARYSVSSGNPDVADSASAAILLTVSQPASNHNGGGIAFGPDGYLYIALGDGGGQNDQFGHGQNLTTLLASVLRIDVDSGSPYSIPADNPFVGAGGSTQEEIWAYGLRNPWRISFDRETGDLFIGDVGQTRLEEVNFQPAASTGGENYGWNTMEGTLCFSPSSGCDTTGLTLPILEYTHTFGCSITGGYRYRGTAIPALVGTYLYADYCQGTIWGGVQNDDGTWLTRVMLGAFGNVSSFGEDEDGEIYVVEIGGAVSRIVSTNTPNDVFADTFDGGDLGQWGGPGVGTEDLAVTGTAGIGGGMGLEVTFDDLERHYIVDETPDGENHYRVRFLFDPNSLTMDENKRHKILTAFSETPSRRLLTFVIRYQSGNFFLRVKGHLDDGSWAQAAWINLGDEPRVLEAEWLKATDFATPDGRLRVWVDDVLQDTLTGLDFDDGSIDFVRFGTVGGTDLGTSGSVYLDDFVTTRHNFIGAP